MHSAPANADARPLLYRWFVEYNPLYLFSAALVLTGCFLLSRGLVREESLVASLGIASVSEVYAFALLGGAALLTRIGPRRPAVMLALLAVLYQWDLTLHTETCAYLGHAGLFASVAWLALFGAKFFAFTRALRVRLAPRAVDAVLLGALGIAIGPHVVSDLGPRVTGELLGVWVFALGALYQPDAITSAVPLDAWGTTVLRRVTRAVWALSAVLLAGHVLVWASNHAISLGYVAPAVPLLYLRRVRSEFRAWTLVGLTLYFGLAAPQGFFVTAFLAGAGLLLRAFSPAFGPEPFAAAPRSAAAQPYRASAAEAHAPAPAPRAGVTSALEPGERIRALTGAVFALHLSAWSVGWAGGPFPHHVAALEAALTAVMLLGAWRLRSRAPLAPLAASYAHWAAQEHLVPMPRSDVQWGVTAVALGFLLLGGSLSVAYRMRPWPVREVQGRGGA
jgi:hypothetical protein